MYVTIRTYVDKGCLIDRLAPLVRDGLVPLLKRAPGFRTYYAFSSADGDAVSVSIFDDREQARRADEQVRTWVTSNLRDLLTDPPEATARGVLVHEEVRPQQQSAGGETFVVIRHYDGLTGSPDRAAGWVREDVVPRLKEQSGFRGFYNFARDGDATRGGSVTFWDGHEMAV